MSNDAEREEMLSPHQRLMAAGVAAVLDEFAVRYTETMKRVARQSWCEFHIATPPGPALEATIAFVSDCVHFVANEAEARLEWAAWDYDTARWINDVPNDFRALLQHDLRIRVRRTFFGHATGAIWFPGPTPGEGAWNGDRAATRGKGEERVFPQPWYVQKPRQTLR
jgi:hypothetical protein